MQESLQNFMSPEQKIDRFKKGLFNALKCITIKCRYKQFNNSIYGNWHQENRQTHQTLRKSVLRNKEENKRNILVIKQRNSFPRPGRNSEKTYKNTCHRTEKQNVEPYQIVKQRQQGSRKFLINIAKAYNHHKHSKICFYKESSHSGKELNLSINYSFQDKVLKQQNSLVINKIQNSLRINKKIINFKPDKYSKLPSRIQPHDNTLQINHQNQNDNKVFNPQLYCWNPPNNKSDQLCRWSEEDQYKLSSTETPAFDHN